MTETFVYVSGTNSHGHRSWVREDDGGSVGMIQVTGWGTWFADEARPGTTVTITVEQA